MIGHRYCLLHGLKDVQLQSSTRQIRKQCITRMLEVQILKSFLVKKKDLAGVLQYVTRVICLHYIILILEYIVSYFLILRVQCPSPAEVQRYIPFLPSKEKKSGGVVY